MNKNKKMLVALSILAMFIAFTGQASAFTLLDKSVFSGGCISGSGPTCINKCIDYGDCELNDFVRLAVQVAQMILSVTGSLALLALVYGGVLFLISAGSTEMVSKAKRIIFYAVIGIIIVLVSYTIIAFIFTVLGITQNPFTTGWFR